MTDFYITLVPLPRTVHGAVMQNPDGSNQIYINSNLCDAKREKALKHEILHVIRDHLSDPRNVEDVETEVLKLLEQ